MSGGVEWFTARRSVLIFPSVPCRKHWDVTRQIKSLAQLIRSAQNGWGGDRRWCDLMSPVWQEFIQNLGIPLEVKRGKRCNISNLNGILSSKHIFCLGVCQDTFFWCHIQLPSREKRNLSTLLCIFKHFGRIESDVGCKKCLKEIIFAGSAALLLIEVNV